MKVKPCRGACLVTALQALNAVAGVTWASALPFARLRAPLQLRLSHVGLSALNAADRERLSLDAPDAGSSDIASQGSLFPRISLSVLLEFKFNFTGWFWLI
jgi:hypothetical protein